MAGVLYTIDLNDKASAKVRSLTATLNQADYATNKLSGHLNNLSLNTLTAKINNLRGLRDNVDVNSRAFRILSKEINSSERQLNNLTNKLKVVSLNTLTAKINNLRGLRDNVDVNSRAFRILSKEINSSERQLNSLSNTGRNTSGVMGLAFSALAYGGLRLFTSGLKTAINAQIELEQATTRFTVLMNSSFKANKFVDWATQYANVTPLLRKDILAVSGTLLQYGLEEGKVRDAVKAIGDISGGDANRFNSLALAYGQVKAAGRLRGQELLQFQNAGYSPMWKLSEMTGKSMATLRDEMAKGLITFEMIAEVFRKDTEAGGRFHGMLNKMSQTVGGKISTLLDAYNTKMATMGQRFDGVTKWGVGALTTLVNTKGAIEAIGVSLAALTVTMGIAALRATALGNAMLSSSTAFLTNPYVLAIAGLTALGIAIYNVKSKYDELAYSAEKAHKIISEKGKELTGQSEEKDTNRKVEFESNKRRQAALTNIINNTQDEKKREAAKIERQTLTKAQEEIAKYYFDKYGYSIVNNQKVLNNMIGRKWEEALNMMTTTSYDFFQKIGKIQGFVSESVGKKETYKELKEFFDQQNLNDAQRKALYEGNLDDVTNAFKVPYRFTLWKDDTEERAYDYDLHLPSPLVQNKTALELNTKALRFHELRMGNNPLKDFSFDRFLEKPEQDASPSSDLNSQISALQTGIVSGGSRTTNIYIQPQKALLNIEQWLGDTQDSVKLVGSKVAEELDRILASFIPSTQM